MQIHLWPVAVLSVFLSFVGSSVPATRGEEQSRRVRQSGGDGFVSKSRRTKERQARPRQKPNVLFLSIDDLNDWIGALGGHPQARTPNLGAPGHVRRTR